MGISFGDFPSSPNWNEEVTWELSLTATTARGGGGEGKGKCHGMLPYMGTNPPVAVVRRGSVRGVGGGRADIRWGR